ncbi:hypothetical protein BDW22DRAFT_465076 [Trametopsis cervina]|nr:hypothetical protein BDW22DRAFT_465076 [Trametopsis cervina]
MAYHSSSCAAFMFAHAPFIHLHSTFTSITTMSRSTLLLLTGYTLPSHRSRHLLLYVYHHHTHEASPLFPPLTPLTPRLHPHLSFMVLWIGCAFSSSSCFSGSHSCCHTRFRVILFPVPHNSPLSHIVSPSPSPHPHGFTFVLL